MRSAFVRAGWRARKSSWTDYEIGCEWAEIGMFVHDGQARFAGVVGPKRARTLAEMFAGSSVSCTVELYADNPTRLIRELRVDALSGD